LIRATRKKYALDALQKKAEEAKDPNQGNKLVLDGFSYVKKSEQIPGYVKPTNNLGYNTDQSKQPVNPVRSAIPFVDDDLAPQKFPWLVHDHISEQSDEDRSESGIRNSRVDQLVSIFESSN